MIARRWRVQFLGCAVLLAAAFAANVSSAATRPSLTVEVVGKGRVTSLPQGIDCPGVCRSSYPVNARVRLVARPASGWRLKAWSGSCHGSRQCVAKLASGTRVVATFAKAPAVPAKVVLQKSGFSVAGSDTVGAFVGLGLVLKNVSPDEDALDITVTVNILDASNGVLETEASTIEAIPAGTTYYFGANTSLDGREQPSKLEVVLQVGRRAKKS
jgi:hypothetical protein